MSRKRIRIFYLHFNFCSTKIFHSNCIYFYLSISASSGESCTGILGDSVAVIVTSPEIGGSSLGGKKDTASHCRDCEDEKNEE